MISIYESLHRQVRQGSIWTQLHEERGRILSERVEIISVEEKFQDVMEVGDTTKMVKRSLGIHVSFKSAENTLAHNVREMKLDGFLSRYGVSQ
jgi:hypothetical protein